MGKVGDLPPPPPQGPDQNPKMKDIGSAIKPTPIPHGQGELFLGMSFTPLQWAKFMAQLASDVVNKIKHDQDRMTKAMKKWDNPDADD